MLPPFHQDRARPRAVVYVHLSAEAFTTNTGGGPSRRRRPGTPQPTSHPARRPLHDQREAGDRSARGHIPVDSYEIPAWLREQLQPRNPADVFPYAAAVSRRIDLDHTIPYLHPDKGGPPGQTSIDNLGPPHPPPPPTQDSQRMAGPTTRTRHLALAITPPPHLPCQRHRHPPPRRHRIRPHDLARRRRALTRTGELTRPPRLLPP
jgi:hypothetical protein